MKKLIASLIFTAAVLSCFCAVCSANTIYVSASSGKDTNTGTFTAPFATIQKAADSVLPGDTVIVMPGIYYESVCVKTTGTADKPIIFRAYENEKDKVIITMADRDILEHKVRWTCEDAELGLYSVPFSNTCPRMLYNGADMHLYGSFEKLKTFSDGFTGEHYTQNSPHGYWYDEAAGKMYVRIAKDSPYGSSDPNENDMWVARGEKNITGYTNTGGRVNALNFSESVSTFAVVTEAPSYIVISGFTFVEPYYNGVYVRGSDVTVSDCWFYGCMTGVTGAARHYYDGDYISDNVKVQYCSYSSWPTYEDSMNIMEQRMREVANGGYYGYSYHFWQKKYIFNEHTMASTFGGYENGGFIGHAGHNWILCHNHIDNQLDGISFYGLGTYSYYRDGYGSSVAFPIEHNALMYENRFERCLDNAIEFDGVDNGVEMFHNEFVDCFEPFSWQPLAGTPFPKNLILHHNLVYCNDEFRENWYRLTNYQYRIGCLKLGIGRAYWQQLPWLMAEPYDYVNGTMFFKPRSEEKGMRFYNNTVVLGDEGSFINEVGTTGTDVDKPNFIFRNNLVQSMVFTGDPERAENSICREDRGYDFEGNMFINKNNAYVQSDPQKGFLSNGGKKADCTLNDVFTDPENNDFSLKEGSPAIGAGIVVKEESMDTSDAGAIPYGEKWDITYSPHPYGDIDCDGVITLKDISLVNLLIGESSGVKRYTERADMDFNGIIDEKDAAIAVEQYSLFGKDGGDVG